MFALLYRHHLQHLCEACKPSTGQEAQILAIANFERSAVGSSTFRDNLPVQSSKQSKKKPWTACHLKMEPTDCPEMYVTTYQYTLSNIPVAERSKAWVCSRSPPGIAGSNPAEGMDNQGRFSIGIYGVFLLKTHISQLFELNFRPFISSESILKLKIV